MTPNSEDSQIPFSNRRGWGMEMSDKEPFRPPVYNPEDYATSLKKWGKKGSSGIPMPQYLSQSTGSLEKLSEGLSLKNERQSSSSTKSISSVKSEDEKSSKNQKELTLKIHTKDLKNKENINRGGLRNNLQKNMNPILNPSTQTVEMSLRQFSSVSELLTKLKIDLKLSFPSFVQEFIGDPIDGVTLLLELLRCVQLSQTSQTSQQQRCPPQILRKALLDEHSCLVCLKHCLRCSDASRRLASSPAGLFTLAVCIMSNVTQSRIIALELLIKACEPQAGGHKAVSEALSTLRLRFGEPVRFRFLVGMLSSAGAVELLTTAMKFINVFVESAPNLQQKVYIQAELEQAGFNANILRKTLPSNSETVRVELNKWEKSYFDVEKLLNKVIEVNALHEKVHLLEKRIKILQEEKEILQSLEQCLKARCSELEEEVSTKTKASSKTCATKHFRKCDQNRNSAEKEESTPAEDEGISSSEQELSQDEDYVKGSMSYSNQNDLQQKPNLKKIKREKQAESETKRYLTNSSKINLTSNCNFKNQKNIRSNAMKETDVDNGNEIIPLHDEDDEEETTIDEVIEELENIINNAETEAYANEEKIQVLNTQLTTSFVTAQRDITLNQIRQNSAFREKTNFEESEIIPTILHPQPPKKAKCLVHIYFPGSDFDSHDCNKNEFFEGSDSETSDSLLTATREEKSLNKDCHRSLEVVNSFNSHSSLNTRTFYIKQDQESEDSEMNLKTSYEERNFNEEKQKKNHSENLLRKDRTKFSEVIFKNKNLQEEVQSEKRFEESNEELLCFKNNCKKISFQTPKNGTDDKILSESSFSRTPKFVPTPVKRSQTFHITSYNQETSHQKIELKPKPKMGLSGLDFLRSSEQKTKSNNWKYQFFDCNTNTDRDVNANDKFLKRVSKESQINDIDDGMSSSRPGSFSGSFPLARTNRENNTTEVAVFTTSFSNSDKSTTMVKFRRNEKADERLNSSTNIAISSEENRKPKPRNDWRAEVTKNIGPRTRRSLAESSLFCQTHAQGFNKPEESKKPPKPAVRTSLTRNNSSTTSSPIEIKLAPTQLNEKQQYIYNFDQVSHAPQTNIKPAKSVDSLYVFSQAKRCPPDGACNPIELQKNQENQKFTDDISTVYSTFLKSPKFHTFFGNSKFNSGPHSEQCASQSNFKGNCKTARNEKSGIQQPTNLLSTANCSQGKLKSQIKGPNLPKVTNNASKRFGVKENQAESKPNFLIRAYQEKPSRIIISKPKITNSVLQSVNTFDNNSFKDRNSAQGSIYSGLKKSCTEIINSRQSNAKSGSEKVTDSPSGLY